MDIEDAPKPLSRVARKSAARKPPTKKVVHVPTLDELYESAKLTPAVMRRILAEDSFEKINDRYCEKVCRLSCKQQKTVSLTTSQVDILIIQDHRNPPSRWDKFEGQQDQMIDGILQFLCRKAGIQGLNYRLTTLLKCPATNSDFPGGKPPTQTVMLKCYPYLKEEIARSKPKVIVSLGTASTKALGLKKFSNTGNRGEIGLLDNAMHPWLGEGQYLPVIPTLHPKILQYVRQNARGSAGMWGPDYMNVIIRDLEKAVALATGRLTYRPDTLTSAVALAKNRIRITRSLEEVSQVISLLNSLPEKAVISFDTETTGLDPLAEDFRILCCQFGWRDPATKEILAAVIPLWHRSNLAYDPQEAWKIVAPILENSKRAKVGHNIKYDVNAVYWATELLFGKGLRIQGVAFDTMLLMHALESGRQGTYGLKQAVWDFLPETGLGGYEDLLGDLKDIEKEREKDPEVDSESEYAEFYQRLIGTSL